MSGKSTKTETREELLAKLAALDAAEESVDGETPSVVQGTATPTGDPAPADIKLPPPPRRTIPSDPSRGTQPHRDEYADVDGGDDKDDFRVLRNGGNKRPHRDPLTTFVKSVVFDGIEVDEEDERAIVGAMRNISILLLVTLMIALAAFTCSLLAFFG